MGGTGGLLLGLTAGTGVRHGCGHRASRAGGTRQVSARYYFYFLRVALNWREQRNHTFHAQTVALSVFPVARAV